jgi:hypothetical protein
LTKSASPAAFPTPLVLILIAMIIGRFWFHGYLNVGESPLNLDTDDALRLAQVREFLNGAGWYDMRISRLAPPEGYVSHWSRLPDLVMASIFRIASFFVQPVAAENVMRTIYPTIWLVPSIFCVAHVTHRLTGNVICVAASIFVIALNLYGMAQFSPGRIDHHGLQIALVLIAFVAFLESKNRNAMIFVAAVSIAILVNIGLEALPFAIAVSAGFAIRYTVSADATQQLRRFCIMLAIAVIIALAAAQPPENWLKPICDAISGNVVLAVVVGCILQLVAMSIPSAGSTWEKRAATVGLSAAGAAATYVIVNPDCLNGPYGAVHPELFPLWHDWIFEVTSLVSFSPPELLFGKLPLYHFLLPVFGYTAWLLWRRPESRTEVLVATLLMSLLSFILALKALRMVYYGHWLIVPLMCYAAYDILRNATKTTRLLWLPVLLLLSPFGLNALTTAAENRFVPSAASKPVADEAKEVSEDCFKSKPYLAMASLPKGLFLSRQDLGPLILTLTAHDVYTAGYHRIGDRIVEAEKFFRFFDDQEAKAFVTSKKIDYLAVCANAKGPAPPTSMQYILSKGVPPVWLEPVVGEGAVRVFRVLR